MWSCRLNRIKSSNLKTSITNSESLAEGQVRSSFADTADEKNYSYFFTKIGRWQHLIELFIASNVLAMVLALAEAQGWQALTGSRLLQYVLYINWVLLAFTAFIEYFQRRLGRMSLGFSLGFGFLLLQLIVLVTTLSLNLLTHFGQNFYLCDLTAAELGAGLDLHLNC